MPSKAYNVFLKNLQQADKLIQAFYDLRPPTRGRKSLDHFTRAAVLFLCSSWEVYIEQIAVEACTKIAQTNSLPSTLPKQIRKTLSSAVKTSKDESEPIHFATDWKEYYVKRTEAYVQRLNTPKNGQVIEIMDKYLGADIPSLKSQVPSLQDINSIVIARGEIAHNIYSDEYVKAETVVGYKETVVNLVKEIELFLWNYLPSVTDGRRPWQNTY